MNNIPRFLETKNTSGHFFIPSGSERMRGMSLRSMRTWARILVSKETKITLTGHFFIPSGSERMRGMSLRSMRTWARILVSKETKITLTGHFYFLAEARGFEPPRHCCPHDFESCAFNHSATLPLLILSHPSAKDKL